MYIIVFIILFLCVGLFIYILTPPNNNASLANNNYSDNDIINIESFINGDSNNETINVINNPDTILTNERQSDFDIKDFKSLILNDLVVFEHADLEPMKSMNENLVYSYITNIDSNYYFHMNFQYAGQDDLELRNIYINSNQIPKATILEVTDDGYTKKVFDGKIVESVDFEVSQNMDLKNYFFSDSVNIIFMGFKKNERWKLPDNQKEILKKSYLYYESLKENNAN